MESDMERVCEAPVLPEMPAPVQIIECVDTDSDHSFKLNEAALEHILLNPKVANKKVAVVSVAGAFRKGKSFLLNFFLKYLQQQSCEVPDWLGNGNVELAGFSWRGGCERETNGLLIWRDPFILKNSAGEEIAVLLMDTQGAFDSQSTVKDCATVFALSTMISSVQIYNLSQNIQEDDLQHLQLFTEYGRLALEGTNAKPFQTLLFLVRDWSFPYEAEYGYLGGQRILDRRLELSDKQHPELQQLRKHITACFESTQCFLMPHPGLKVATSPDFKGQLNDVEDEFKQQLRSLVPRVLSGDSIVLKEINGSSITCRELLEYFKAYTIIFQGEELPEPKSMLLATAEANNLAAVGTAKEVYVHGMQDICGGDTPFMAPDDLLNEHERCRADAIDVFKQARKMGGDEFSLSFLEKLDDHVNDSYDEFVKFNNGKNLFRWARTPSVLFVILIIDYVCQEIFQLLYLDVFATTCSSFLGIILLTLALWAYSRYSGNFREAGSAIDELAEFIWQNVLSPLSNLAVREGVKHVGTLQRKLSENPSVQRSSSSISNTSRKSNKSNKANKANKTYRKEE